MEAKFAGLLELISQENLVLSAETAQSGLEKLGRMLEGANSSRWNGTSIELFIYCANRLLGVVKPDSDMWERLCKTIDLIRNLCLQKNFFWPELKYQPEPLNGFYNELQNAIIEDFRKIKGPVKQIEQLAPRFYTKDDKREFNKTEELKKLKEKQRRLKKKLVNEIVNETTLRLSSREDKERKMREINIKRANRFTNELQQQKKAIEKENTSLAASKRIKKKGNRKAGGKF